VSAASRREGICVSQRGQSGVRAVLGKALTSSLGKNIASLYVLHFANYLLPLITVPYLVRVLGPERFGAVAFAQSFILYFVLVINFGFDWSATREVSVHRADSEMVSRIASSVWGSKALLCLLSLGILIILLGVVPKLAEISPLALVLFGTAVGNVLFPTWLLQGLERMVAMSVVNLLTRLAGTASIFLFVRRPSDTLLYATILGLQAVAGGVAAGLLGVKLLGSGLRLPSWTSMRSVVGDGSTLFLCTGAISLYTTGSCLILGLVTDHVTVGYFAAAQKIVSGATGLLGPVSQAAYPRFSKLAAESKTAALLWSRRLLGLMGGGGLAASLGLFVGAGPIVRVALGPGYEPCTPVLQVLALLPFLVACSNVFGVQIMFPFRHDKAMLVLLLIAGCFNIVAGTLFSLRWQAVGMASTVLLTEAFVTTGQLVYLSTVGLNPLENTWSRAAEAADGRARGRLGLSA
jgi:PST family polysaccharide transporter